MKTNSTLKLIDLLSLRPGSLLHIHVVKGEAGCNNAEALATNMRWQEKISNAFLPNGDTQKRHNLSKLLEVPIETQVLIRHDNNNVIEIMHLEEMQWKHLSDRIGLQADVMVEGKVFAEGEIVKNQQGNGILIKRVISSPATFTGSQR